MNFIEIIKIALQAIRTNKSRTVLTMLGIIIGVTSVILLVSIGNGLKSYITDQLESLGGDSLFIMPGELEIGPPTGGGNGGGGMPGAGITASKFTFDHINDLKAEGKTLKTVMAYIESNGTLRYKGNALASYAYKGKTMITQVAGVGPEYPGMRDQKVTAGTFFTASQYNAAKKVVVLGKTVADKLFGQEDPLGKRLSISDQQYTVLGILEAKGAFGGLDLDNQVFIPATTSMRQFDTEYIQSLWVQAQDQQSIPEATAEIKKILGKTLKADEFSVLDTKSILNTISQILGVLTAALGGIAAISLVVGGVGIMNIMLVSVTERTREIGLRKAIGATPKTILTQFLVEAVVLSVGGGLIGIALGLMFLVIINHFFPAVITVGALVLAFSVSALIGIVFGVAPALRASRLNPIDALRYE